MFVNCLQRSLVWPVRFPLPFMSSTNKIFDVDVRFGNMIVTTHRSSFNPQPAQSAVLGYVGRFAQSQASSAGFCEDLCGKCPGRSVGGARRSLRVS
jgi:hypothetical protein